MKYSLLILTLLAGSAQAQGIIKHVSEPIYMPVPQYAITPEVERRTDKLAEIYTRGYTNAWQRQQQTVPIWQSPFYFRPIYVMPQTYHSPYWSGYGY